MILSPSRNVEPKSILEATPADSRPNRTSVTLNMARVLTGTAIFIVVAIVAGAFVASTSTPKVASNVDVNEVGLPFIAIATGLERFWETLVAWYETFMIRAGCLLGEIGNAGTFVAAQEAVASKAIETLTAQLKLAQSQAEIDAVNADLKTAAETLANLQLMITNSVKSPAYVALKQAITQIGSLGLGLVLAISGHLYLLRRAGFNVPPEADLIITGLLIGSGPGPLHQAIGILQNLKDATAALAQSRKLP